TVGETLNILNSYNKGGFIAIIIASICYYLPFINLKKNWIFTLIYFILITFILTNLLQNDKNSRKLALLFHLFSTMLLGTPNHKNTNIFQIWNIYLLLPLTYICCLLPVTGFFIYNNYCYKMLLYNEIQS